MPSVSGGLSTIYTLVPGVQTTVNLPHEASLLDSVILYNYSSLLCQIYCSGLYAGWLSPWSVDRFQLGNAGSVIVQPVAAAGSTQVNDPISQELVAAFLLSEEGVDHLGKYPSALTAPDQQAAALIQAQAALLHASGVNLAALTSNPPQHPSAIGSTPPPPPAPQQTRYFTAVSSQSWRTDVGWEGSFNGDYVYQGHYGSYGNNRGCWFFGDQFYQYLHGYTMDQLSIYLHRDGAGGYAADTPVYVQRHAYLAQPGGEPVPVDGNTTNPCSMAWNDAGWYNLPLQWATDLANRVAYGFELYDVSANNYGRWLGRNEDNASGQIMVKYH